MNTLYVAVWNSLMSPDSDRDKVAAYQAWLKWLTDAADHDSIPALVVLIEASPKMAADANGYVNIGHVDTQAAGGGLGSQPIAKSIVALLHQGKSALQFTNGTTLRFPGLDTAIRAAMKLNVKGSNGALIALWFIHANASDTGGAAMVKAVTKEIAKSDRTAVLGDYNCPFDKAMIDEKGVQKVQPIRHDKANLSFTNWNNKNPNTNSDDDYKQWGVVVPKAARTINPGGILDYALLGTGVKVTALPNTKDATMLGDILRQFDHFPIVYRLDW